ncbi:MAG: hypothetical protein J6K32_08200 [Clostridia bacterium]|nr:hypothetical protein [Clostridia bacterium]
MDRSAADCLVLFDTETEGRLSEGWASGTIRQRTRTTRAGPMIYMECYPVWDAKTAQAARSEARKESHRAAQERLNAKNAQKKLVRLINENFGSGDLILTLTYPADNGPGDEAQAMRDAQNYLRRIRSRRERRGLEPMKYIYVIEETHRRQWGTRYHIHLIMSGGIPREEAEAAWRGKHGGICTCRGAQPDRRKHLTGYAMYLMRGKGERSQEKDGKNPQRRAMRRRWNSSKNLRDPDDAATTADKKVSIRKAGQIAETAGDYERAKEIFARLYPGCELLEITARRSRWTTGVYISAELRRDPGGGKRCESHARRERAGCCATARRKT